MIAQEYQSRNLPLVRPYARSDCRCGDRSLQREPSHPHALNLVGIGSTVFPVNPHLHQFSRRCVIRQMEVWYHMLWKSSDNNLRHRQ